MAWTNEDYVWPELPPNCPPRSADPAQGAYYRFVGSRNLRVLVDACDGNEDVRGVSDEEAAVRAALDALLPGEDVERLALGRAAVIERMRQQAAEIQRLRVELDVAQAAKGSPRTG